MKKLDNGLPWPEITHSEERALIARIKHGATLPAADSLGVTDGSVRNALARARKAMRVETTEEACAMYRAFRAGSK